MNTEEKKFDVDKFKKEVCEVLARHGVYNFSFCGETEDKELFPFIGIVGLDVFESKVTENRGMRLFVSIENVGRLWQFARETSRRMLNMFENKP